MALGRTLQSCSNVYGRKLRKHKLNIQYVMKNVAIRITYHTQCTKFKVMGLLVMILYKLHFLIQSSEDFCGNLSHQC